MRARLIDFIIVWFWILAFSLQSFPQTSDDLFNANILHEVRIYIHPQDWATLRQTEDICALRDLEALAGQRVSSLPRVECDFAIEFHWKFQGVDITTSQVSIHSRGGGSRSPVKPSLKVEFSRYESRNSFLGLRNLVLRANNQDPSSMHERIAMELFRLLEIPAPRESYTRLYVNDQYSGLYTLVEEVDPVFLQRTFGESDGRLYSYEWIDTWLFDYRGPDTSRYSPLPFKPENNLIYLDPAPIEAMVRAINQASDAQFDATVSTYLDLNKFMAHIAVENFLAEQDGILGDFGMNNFFMYRFQNSTLSQLVPWDKSQTFNSVDWPILRHIDSFVLSRRAFAIPRLQNAYLETLRRCAEIAGGPGGWLEQEIIKEYQQIRDAVLEDAFKQCYPPGGFALANCSNAQFEQEVAFLLAFARQRAPFVNQQLAAVGRATGF